MKHTVELDVKDIQQLIAKEFDVKEEQYKRKKRYYHAKQFSGVEEGLLDSFLYDESCKNNNFTVVSVIENPNYCYYTVVYYVKE